MTKYQTISALAEYTARNVAQSEENWKHYLTTAARLYKYTFNEQMLIYAQRQDATACQKYRLEDNIAKHYPQQITILKERISGMQADIQTAKANLPVDKEQFSMKVGDKLYTDKEEAGTALVEICKEIKTVNAPAVIGEYAGFKMAVSFDAFNHKFVMNLKEQLSHNLEVGSDPLGNISRINHALESMPKQLMEAQTKLETVEHQLETARVEVTKPFAQEAELAEKLERLSALNALLNMDEKGNDGIDMDDELEAPKNEKEVADRPAKNIPLAEKTVGTG